MALRRNRLGKDWFFRDVRTADLYEWIESGQRAFRSGKSEFDCPRFRMAIYYKAWKAGFRGAENGKTSQMVLDELIVKLGDYCGPRLDTL